MRLASSEVVSSSLRLTKDLKLPVALEEEDRHFVDRLKARDERAFETMVHLYTAGMLAAARRLLGSEHDAQDAVQQAFISAFRAISGFNAEAKLSTWLHKIVVNAALAQLRSRRRRGRELQVEDLHREFEGVNRWAAGGSWPGYEIDHAIIGRETCQMVRNCIDQLPESYRAVLFLRDIDELDTAEVAERLAISLNATKIRLHRARQALKSLVEEERARTY
jgi:RNA polymerase sigma-70 factor (ECF subfamily)